MWLQHLLPVAFILSQNYIYIYATGKYAFIQSDLHCIQSQHLIGSCIPWESNPWPCRYERFDLLLHYRKEYKNIILCNFTHLPSAMI